MKGVGTVGPPDASFGWVSIPSPAGRGWFLPVGGSVGTIKGMLLFWIELVMLK